MVSSTWVLLKVGGKSAHKAVFVVSMLHLMGNNYYHRYYYWGDFGFNVNGPLMVLTQKMTQLGFSVADGRAKQKPGSAQERCALAEVPSLPGTNAATPIASSKPSRSVTPASLSPLTGGGSVRGSFATPLGEQ